MLWHRSDKYICFDHCQVKEAADAPASAIGIVPVEWRSGIALTITIRFDHCQVKEVADAPASTIGIVAVEWRSGIALTITIRFDHCHTNSCCGCSGICHWNCCCGVMLRHKQITDFTCVFLMKIIDCQSAFVSVLKCGLNDVWIVLKYWYSGICH